MNKVLVSVPVYEGVAPQPFLSFINMTHEATKAELLGRYGARFHIGGPHKKTPLIRNEAAEIMLQMGATHLLFIDNDMVCEKDLIENLLKRDVDMLSPILFKVAPRVEPIAYDRDENGFPVPMTDYPRNSMFQSPGGLGTGVMMISRRVIEELAKDRPIFRWICGEDIDFCKRAMEAGYKCWIDSTIKVKQMSISIPLGEEEYLMSQGEKSYGIETLE